MKDETFPPNAQTLPAVIDPVGAPILYFEEATNSGFINGIIDVTLTAKRVLPDGKGDLVKDILAVAYLRGNVQALMSLRSAIDNALLMAMPPGDKGAKN
jgi:hypothetical protein